MIGVLFGVIFFRKMEAFIMDLDLNESEQKEFNRQLELLSFGVSEITPKDEFAKILAYSIKHNKPLRIKYGIDPTGADVHLGHLVPCRKMRQFQDLGHIGVVIVGDYTARIGDPTGRNESRPALPAEQVKKNGEKYLEQIFTVVDKNKTESKFQSEWFNQVTLQDIILWAGQTTVAKLLSHETFKNRLSDGNVLSLHELFYPVLQGIDSVYVKADVELGGNDQKFNVLMGRDYQKARGMRPQVAMLLPILLGTCGTRKMSKSFGNYIGIFDDPFDKFGKVMSIPDNLMADYYKYLTNISTADHHKIVAGLASNALHPNETKKNLAQEIVSLFHGGEIGRDMRRKFEEVFSRGQAPEDISEIKVKEGDDLLSVLATAKIVATKRDGRRLVQQNAVSFMDGEKIVSVEFKIANIHLDRVIKIGKRRFIKLVK